MIGRDAGIRRRAGCKRIVTALQQHGQAGMELSQTVSVGLAKTRRNCDAPLRSRDCPCAPEPILLSCGSRPCLRLHVRTVVRGE